MEHSVNVLEFAKAHASEIASMMDEMNSSSKKKLAYFQRVPHYMRRRAASQNPKRVPRKLQEPNKPGQSQVRKKYKKKNKQGKFANKGSCYTWLETHIWHAKRFKMETLWGYRIPIQSNDRKIGTTHRAASKHCSVQDLSYYCCIEFVGIQEDLLSKLSNLINPKCGYSFDSSVFLDGSSEGHCLLYHPNSSPFRAIGPVTFLWDPKLNFEKQEHDKQSRKLWIWCHPSFHDELVQVFVCIFNLTKQSVNESDAVKYTFACKLNLEKTKAHFLKEDRYESSTDKVNMNLLCNTLARHRLVGPSASQILARVLRSADVEGPVSSSVTLKSDDGSSVKKLKHSDSYWWETYYVNSEVHKDIYEKQKQVFESLSMISHSDINPRSVIGLTVRDPRCGHHWRESSPDTTDYSESFMQPSYIENPWMSDVAVSPLWDSNIRHEVTATKMSEMELNKAKQNSIVAPDLGERENRIPVILIHRPSINGMVFGWDVIAPLGWSLEFWRCYVKSGSLPTGLRDLRFLNLEAGCPNFPRSFPDTAAGKQEQLARQSQGLAEMLRHPKNQRLNFTALGVPTPFIVHWDVLLKDAQHLCQNSESFPLEMRNTIAEKAVTFADSDAFFVLKKTWPLSRLCSRAKRVKKYSDSDLGKLLSDIDAFLESALTSEMHFFKSLVSVKIDCFNKGRPSEHAGLYLLSVEDMLSLKKSKQFLGPDEPAHPHEKKKCSNKNSKSKTENTDSAGKTKIDTYIDCSSRKMIGYISEGCFSSLCGRGIGIGHSTSIGFVMLVKQCAEARFQPVVLWRNQHSYQFRAANIEMIEDSM